MSEAPEISAEMELLLCMTRDAARAEGRREGLEEAAKVADGEFVPNPREPWSAGYNVALIDIAAAIRALATQEKPNE